MCAKRTRFLACFAPKIIDSRVFTVIRDRPETGAARLEPGPAPAKRQKPSRNRAPAATADQLRIRAPAAAAARAIPSGHNPSVRVGPHRTQLSGSPGFESVNMRHVFGYKYGREPWHTDLRPNTRIVACMGCFDWECEILTLKAPHYQEFSVSKIRD